MLNKLKKNKLPLFLLAIVAMLSVYYIVMPDDEGITAPTGGLDAPTVARYEEFAEARLEILSERNAAVTEYEQKITEATVSLIDVEACVKEIEKLTSLTEKEVYFESVIVRLGYEDCLVYLIEDDNLTISILTDTFTATDYVSIAKSAKEEFGNSTLVTVNIVKKSS